MKLRSHLITLTLAALLPVLIFAAVVGAFLLERERETLRRGAEDRALALITAVDAELNGFIATLTALAHVRSLDEGDMALFRATASQILASQETWTNVNLARPTGQQVMNLRLPESAPLPVIPETAADLKQLTEARKPLIGDLVIGPVTKRWDFAVRVPVMRGGKVAYILSAVIAPDSMSRLLGAQDLPAGWEGMVLDRTGRIVARTVEPEKSRGQFATQGLRDALPRSASGWFRGETLEGRPAYRVYRRSDVTGWTFAMAIPASAVDGAAQRALSIFVLALIAALGAALVLAQIFARRISQPIAALASVTDAMARGERVAVPESPKISELRSLEAALRTAVDAQARLKRAEEQNRSVVDHVLDGIITIDERGAIESFNPAAEKLFGYAASEVVGQNVKILMPEPYHAEHDGYIGNYLATGQAKVIGIGREVLGRRKDGSTFPMELAVSEFHIGAQRFFTGIVRDITQRKRTEEALREADRQKDEFLGVVSHELRNPLSALTAAARLLRVAAPDHSVIAAAMGIIERQTQQMVRLIEDLIDTTRMRMGKLTLKREPLDLAALVSEVARTWREAGRLNDQAAVNMQLSSAWILADRARIEQIVSNLLDNALKFTPTTGSIDVTVFNERSEAVLRVADSGRGIAPESLVHIFDSFVQDEHAGQHNERGLGLGLAVVKRLAELHGGAVSAESAGSGRGATFTVRFPAVAAPDASPLGLEIVAVARDQNRPEVPDKS